MTGNLTLNGNTNTNATSLYVGGNFTINGPSGTSQFGPIYVGGNVNWGGALNVQTTNYTNSAAAAGPVYVGGSFFTLAGGPFTDVFGPTYVAGAVAFSGNNAQITCPLWVTPGNFTTSGSGNFGTVADPMVLLGLSGSTSPMQFGAQGTFTGLVLNMGGGVNLANSGSSPPPALPFFVQGAVMATGDIDFTNNGNVGYSPTVLSNLQVTAGTTTTGVMPGTWQELAGPVTGGEW